MKQSLAQLLGSMCAIACVSAPPSSDSGIAGDSSSARAGALEVEPSADPTPDADPRESARTISAQPAALLVERGEGELALWIPRDESLTYQVVLELGPLGDVHAGQVVLSSGVERYVAGLPAPGAAPANEGLEVAWIRSRATGSYAGYRLDHELRSRLLPQSWPRVFYTDTQTGSENRRRELKIGDLDGELTAMYRADGHCKGCANSEHFVESKWLWGKPHHCEKCKRAEHRVFKDPVRRRLPPGTVDMLSAVYLARSLFREGLSSTRFPMLDRQNLWQVKLSRGTLRRIQTPAGSFEAQEIKLSTSAPPSETKPATEFQGMFGIRGTIQIWLDLESGVPVLIQGELPVPVLGSLDVRVELNSREGSPGEFESSR